MAVSDNDECGMMSDEYRAARFLKFITLHSSFIISFEPLDETPDAFLNRRPRVVAEEPARLRDVGERLRHVAGLQGTAVNDCVAPEFAFEQRDQFAQAHRPRDR